MSMIIPINPPVAARSGGGSYIIIAGYSPAFIAGKNVTVSLNGDSVFSQIIPNNVQSVSVTITEAGVYTVTVGSSSYSVNVASLTGNYLLLIGGDTPSVKVFNSSGTYIPNGNYVFITACGGGGGGNYYAGGGGGASVVNKLMSVTPGQSYSITIGTGGSGSTSSTGNGSSGGSTKFGSLLTLAGGGGAQYNSSNVNASTVYKQLGAPGGTGAGGYQTTSKVISFQINTTGGNSFTTSYNGTGNGYKTDLINNVVDMGLSRNGYQYAQSEWNISMGGGGSIGSGGGIAQLSTLTSAQAANKNPSFGGGGGSYTAEIGNSGTHSRQVAGTSTSIKGANGVMIISEIPLTDKQIFEILGFTVINGSNQNSDASVGSLLTII